MKKNISRYAFLLTIFIVLVAYLYVRSGKFLLTLQSTPSLHSMIYSERDFENNYYLDYDNITDVVPSIPLNDEQGLWHDWNTIEAVVKHSKKDSYKLFSADASSVTHSLELENSYTDFSYITFYFYITDPKLLGSLDLYLLQDEYNYFIANINQPLESNQWNFINVGWTQFNVHGDPSLPDLKEIRINMKSTPGQNLIAYIDDIRYVPNNNYTYDWMALNDSLIQLFALPDESLALAIQNYRERVFYPKKAKPFMNGEISARIYALESGKNCGLVIRGIGEHGFWFVADGFPDLSWKLLGGPDKKILLQEGKSEGILSENNLYYWLKIITDDQRVTIFAGPEQNELEWIATVQDSNPKVGRAGVVVLDNAICLYKNISINYDNHE